LKSLPGGLRLRIGRLFDGGFYKGSKKNTSGKRMLI